jgi:Tol biopolymer transport system component/DNA-binding winged helix-turn-helix (wHTH) protein
VSSPASSHHIYRFSNFEVDLRSGEVRRNGIRLKIQDQPFQILIKLLERADEVVTREELRSTLWPADTFVDFDNGLNTAIKRLREALGDVPERPTFIETVPRHGYRFIAPVDRPHSRAPTAGDSQGQFQRPTAKRIWIGLGAVLLFLLLCVGIWWIPRTAEEAPPATVQVVSLAGASRGYQRTASFSPDGSQLAFDQTGERNSGIYTTLTDGEKSLRLTSNPGDCCPAWSPDGQQVAFSRYSDEGFAIYVVSALGGTEHRLYQVPAAFRFHHPGYLSWSLDAKFLAFSDRKENETHAAIALLALADSTTRRLTTPPAQAYDYAPAFSPDGSKVAFIRSSGSGVASDVFVVPASGGEPRRLTFDNTGTEGTLAWTADSRDIVFSSIRGGLPTLWRISAAGERLGPIAGIGAIACCPCISRQGNQIVYQNSVANDGIWRVDLKDQTHVQGRPNLLISAKGLNLRPDFSSDGSRIAFESDRSGYSEIWTCDSDGLNCGQLSSLHNVAGTARWSPDGHQISFEFNDGEHSEIYLVDVAGGRPRLLPTLPGADNLAPNWSRDGQWIYFTSDHEGGRFDLWKVPLRDGPPVRLTNNGGVYGVESADGRSLYFSKLAVPGIWKMPLNGGEEIRILDQSGSTDWYNWSLVQNGIYFLSRSAKPRETIEFLNFESGKIAPVFSPDKRVDWGVVVSPDGKSLVYGQNDFFQSSLVLVKNFH